MNGGRISRRAADRRTAPRARSGRLMGGCRHGDCRRGRHGMSSRSRSSCRAGSTWSCCRCSTWRWRCWSCGLVVLVDRAGPGAGAGAAGARARSAARAGLSYTLYYATTFVFTGLAVAVAFHGGLFNIGGEGQAMLGGLGTGAGRAGARPINAAGAGCVLPLMVRRRRAVRHGLGGGAGRAAGLARQPRRDHDDHVQLHRLGAAVYLLVNVLKEPGNMTPESRAFGPARARCPACTRCSPGSASSGRARRST